MNLRAKAKGIGLSLENHLIGLPEEPSTPPQAISAAEWDEWLRVLDEALDTIPSLSQDQLIDDSRESIYEGCGE